MSCNSKTNLTKRWKVGYITGKSIRILHGYAQKKIRKAKEKLEMQQARNIKGNKKGFYKVC